MTHPLEYTFSVVAYITALVTPDHPGGGLALRNCTTEVLHDPDHPNPGWYDENDLPNVEGLKAQLHGFNIGAFTVIHILRKLHPDADVSDLIEGFIADFRRDCALEVDMELLPIRENLEGFGANFSQN